MLEQGISRGAENVSDPCFRKKPVSEKSKGLKQRAKALSDVKNTIHSHASNCGEKTNKKNKKTKNTGKIGFGKSTMINDMSTCCSVVGDENEIKSGFVVSQPEFECINHFLCEKANTFNQAEFLDEYKLNRKELECFGNRWNFFTIEPRPFRISSMSPVEDVEIRPTNYPSLFDDEDGIGDFSIEVPAPPCFS